MDLTKFFNKADEAIKRKNYDFAIEILKNQILKLDPTNIDARIKLRAVELEKHKNKGEPSQADKLSKGLVPRIKMFVGKLMKKWEMVIEEAENYLVNDPKNTSVLYDLSEACMNAGYIDTAIAVLDNNVLKFDPKHFKALKTLGLIYDEHKKDLEQAEKYYQKAAKVNPQDHEAAKLAKSASARKTADVYKHAKSSHDLIKDKAKAEELESDQALRTEEDFIKAIQRIKKKLAEDPNNKKDLRKLGEFYQKIQKYDDAMNVYAKVIKLDSSSFDIKCRVSDCKIAKIDKHMRSVDKKLKSNPQDKELQQQLKKIKILKAKTEIEEYTKQVADQPTNAELHNKLGNAYLKGGKYDEAIASFQKAVKDPKFKVKSYISMGQAFINKNDFDMAIGQLQSALQLISPKDVLSKEIKYNLGIAYEKSNNKDKAIEVFTDIYQSDIQFKDVGQRLKKLRG